MTPIAPIEVQGLRQAMSQGQESVRELIRGPKQTPYQREEQVKRCEQALDLMKTELKNDSKEQKNLILKATRDILEESRTDVLEQLRTGADERMKQLQEKIEHMRTRRTEEEKEIQSEKTSTPSAPAKTAEAEAWLPQTMDVREWSGKQIATVSALTVGAIGVVYLGRKLWRWMTGASGDQEQGKKKGWGSLIYWIPGIGLAALGLYAGHKMLMKFDKYAKMIGGLEDKVKGMLPGSKEAEYGLSKEDYEKAEHIYKTKGEKGRKEIAAIFGAKEGESNPKFEKFMKDMQEKYKVEVSRNGVNYVKASLALQNYEDDLGTALFELGKWVERHKFEVAAGAIIAARLNILQSILTSPLSIAKKAAEIGKTMLKWGIHHPLLSLFLLGGSIIGLKKLKDNVFLPENLHQLSKACMNGELFMGVDEKDMGDAATSALNGLKDLMNKIGEIGENVMQWIGKHLETLVVLISESVPEMVGMTPEELIAQNNEACMDALHHYLEMQLRGVRTSSDRRNEGRGDVCEKAIQELEEFRIAYLRTRCTEDRENDTAPALLRKLKASLAAVDITVDDTGEVVTWKSKDMPEAFDLCVHPSITDRAKLKALSERLRHGENFVNYWLSNALDQVRERQEQARKAGEKVTSNKGIAMVVGNFLYIFDDPFGNTLKYFMVPVDLAMDALGIDPFNMTASRDWSDWAANVTGGAITSAAFSLNAAWIAKLKRMAIGGGPLYQGWKTRMIMNITPGLSQINMVRGMVKTAHDVKILKMFGWLEGRRINNALAHANIRPEIVGIIETGSDADLMKVANEIGASLRNDTDLVTKRAQLREYVQRKMRVKELRLKEVPAKLRTAKFWKWSDAFRGKEIAYQDELYKMLMVKFAKPQDLMKAGYKATDLLAAGAEMDDLLHATTHLDDAARTAMHTELRALGATADDFLKAGKDAAAWKAAGGAADDFVAAEKAAAIGLAKAAPKAPTAPKAPVTPKAPAATAPSSGAKAPVESPTTPHMGPSGIAAPTEEAAEDLTRLFDKMNKAKNGATLADDLKIMMQGNEELKSLLFKNPNLIKNFNGSRQGQALLAGAIRTKDATEVARVLKAGQSVSKFAVGMNMLGVGADVFGLVMAFADWQANDQKIEQARESKNEALVELYQTARIRIAVEGGVSATSLVIQGVAIGVALKGGATTGAALAAGAGATLYLLPVAAAVIAGSYVAKDLEEAAETWLRGESEWKKLSPPELLHELNKIAPGNAGFFRSVALIDNFSLKEGFDKAEKSNQMARLTILRVYVIKTSILPRYEPRDPEGDTEYKLRFDRYVTDQLEYLAWSSRGEGMAWTHALDTARSHARLCEASRQAKLLGMSYPVEVSKKGPDGKPVVMDLANYADKGFSHRGNGWDEKSQNKLLMLNAYRRTEKTDEAKGITEGIKQHAENPTEQRRFVQEHLLMEVQDYILALEGKILGADFEGLDVPWISEGDTEGKFLCMYTASALIRQALRVRAEELLKKGDKITAQDVQGAVNAVRAECIKNPLDYQKIGWEKGWAKNIDKTSRQQFLSISWIAQNLDLPLPDTANLHTNAVVDGRAFVSKSQSVIRMNAGGILRLKNMKGYQYMKVGSDLMMKSENGRIIEGDEWAPQGKGFYVFWNPGRATMYRDNNFSNPYFAKPDSIVYVQGNDDFGQDIDHPIFTGSTYHPDIRAPQDQLFLQMPNSGYNWTMLNAQGAATESMTLNQTPQHNGKCCVTRPNPQTLHTRIRVWNDKTGESYFQSIYWDKKAA